MQNFLKYPSLKLPTVDTFRRLPAEIALKEWYAFEKLNGTNVSVVYTEENGFEYFNRKIELTDKHKVSIVKNTLDKGLGSIMKHLMTYNGYERIHVFGELFGAGIHKMTYDLNEQGLKDFKVFSVFLYKGKGLYDVLSLNLLLKYFEGYLAPFEGRGTLFEMLTLDKDALSHFGGEREGYVIMPVEQVVYDKNLPTPFFNGIKVKYGKYAEKSKGRIKVAKDLTFTDEENVLFEELTQYATVSRVLNVQSNIDIPLEKRNIGKFMRLLNEDIVKEFEDDIPESVDKNKVLLTFEKTLSKVVIEAIEENNE